MQLISYLKKSWTFYLGLMLTLFFTLTITGFSLKYFPGDLGDARFNMYLLEHCYQFFTGNINEFWSAPFMYPEPNVISYSDNLLGVAPFYSLFRFLSFDRETAFQLWFILVFLLNYSCAFGFLRAVFKNKYAAVLGALIFTLSLSVHSQMSHAQMFARFCIPLAFWMCFLFYKNLNPKYFFCAVFFVVYQFYCGIYLGFFLLIPISLFILFSLLVKAKEVLTKLKNWKWVLSICVSTVINALFLLFLMQPYIERSAMVGTKSYQEVLHSIPTLKSFLFTDNGTLLWSFLRGLATDYTAFWDHQIFPGGVAIVSFVIFSILIIRQFIFKSKGQCLKINTTSKIFFAISIITFLLFIRYQGTTLYTFLFSLPGFSSLRCITRIINIELLFFAFAVSFVSKILLDKFKGKWLFVFLLVIVLLDNAHISSHSLYRTEKSVAIKRVQILENKMQHIPNGAVVSYEPLYMDSEAFCQIDAMLAAQSLNLKSVNGYSATAPYKFGAYWMNPTKENRLNWFKEKQLKLDTCYVIK